MRDDIVIRPSLKQPAQASTRAIEDRAMRAQARTRGGGALSVVAAAQAARSHMGMRVLALRAAAGGRSVATASVATRALAISPGSSAALARRGLRIPEGGVFDWPTKNSTSAASTILSPTGRLAAAAAALGAGYLIGKKLETGKSFQLLADEYVEKAFGDLDEQALAAADARAAIPPQWLGIIDRAGGVPDDIALVYRTLYERALQKRRGETLIRLDRRFDAQSTIDHVVVRAADGVEKVCAHIRSSIFTGGEAK